MIYEMMEIVDVCDVKIFLEVSLYAKVWAPPIFMPEHLEKKFFSNQPFPVCHNVEEIT